MDPQDWSAIGTGLVYGVLLEEARPSTIYSLRSFLTVVRRADICKHLMNKSARLWPLLGKWAADAAGDGGFP
jgi:hypothetical protein